MARCSSTCLLIPALGSQMSAFKASLVYSARPRIARVTQRNLASKSKRNPKKTENQKSTNKNLFWLRMNFLKLYQNIRIFIKYDFINYRFLSLFCFEPLRFYCFYTQQLILGCYIICIQ